LTLTFKLIRASDETRLPCEVDAHPLSGSGDISYTNKKTQTDGAKNRTSRSSPRAVITGAKCNGLQLSLNQARAIMKKPNILKAG